MNVFNIFIGPTIMRGHGKMPGNCQSKALVKLAEVKSSSRVLSWPLHRRIPPDTSLVQGRGAFVLQFMLDEAFVLFKMCLSS